MKRLSLLAALTLISLSVAGCGSSAQGSSGKLFVVGAENFYGDMLAQIGGSRVDAISLLSNPNADPHEFESSAHDATDIARADLVVENGLGYDAWMDHLLSGSPSNTRLTINAGALAGHHTGDNPHIWYDVSAMMRLSRTIAGDLGHLDPSGKSYFAARQAHFVASLRPIEREMAAIRLHHAGVTVAQTEPVFAYMLRAIGLHASEGAFQRSIEDGNDPSPRNVIAFQSQLESRRVHALLYNLQTVRPVTQQMQTIARSHGVPVVGVTETEPKGKTYQTWMLSQLQQLSHALDGSQ